MCHPCIYSLSSSVFSRGVRSHFIISTINRIYARGYMCFSSTSIVMFSAMFAMSPPQSIYEAMDVVAWLAMRDGSLGR